MRATRGSNSTGGAIGIVLGTGAVHGARAWLDLRSAHMVLNVLGWVSLTIAGTLVTLLPTVLRVRMPAWAGRTTGGLFAIGVVVMAGGLALGVSPVAVVGGVAYAGAVAGLLVMVRNVLATQRKWPVPVSAKHLLLSLTWFACGAGWLLVELIRGVSAFTSANDLFIVVFGGGWILQTLLGAWLYLLPMGTPPLGSVPPEQMSAYVFATTLECGRPTMTALRFGERSIPRTARRRISRRRLRPRGR